MSKRIEVRTSIINCLMGFSVISLYQIQRLCDVKFDIKTIKKYLAELVDEGVVLCSLYEGQDGRISNVYRLSYIYPFRKPSIFNASTINHICVSNARAIPLLEDERLTGRYYPATTRIAARTVCNLAIPVFYYDKAGFIVREYEPALATFWNSSYATKGKGLADIAAKTLSSGKNLSFKCNVQSYQGRVFNNGKMVISPDGTPVTVPKQSLVVIPGTLLLGEESAKTVAYQEANYIGQIDFHSRPPVEAMGLNTRKVLLARTQALLNTTYKEGNTEYGYAKVIKKEGLP